MDKSVNRAAPKSYFPNSTQTALESIFSTEESRHFEEYMMCILRCHCGYSPRTRFYRSYLPGERLYYCGAKHQPYCKYLSYHSGIAPKYNGLRLCNF